MNWRTTLTGVITFIGTGGGAMLGVPTQWLAVILSAGVATGLYHAQDASNQK